MPPTRFLGPSGKVKYFPSLHCVYFFYWNFPFGSKKTGKSYLSLGENHFMEVSEDNKIALGRLSESVPIYKYSLLF